MFEEECDLRVSPDPSDSDIRIPPDLPELWASDPEDHPIAPDVSDIRALPPEPSARTPPDSPLGGCKLNAVSNPMGLSPRTGRDSLQINYQIPADLTILSLQINYQIPVDINYMIPFRLTIRSQLI